MLLNSTAILSLLGGLTVNLIAVIILISKIGIFIGKVNETLIQHEKRINTLENCVFTRRSSDNI
jgi:hypothetical protein